MKPGVKTTELYLVIATMIPSVLQQLGKLPKGLDNPEDIAQIISDAHAQGGTSPVWLIALYVAARLFLKWQENNIKLKSIELK